MSNQLSPGQFYGKIVKQGEVSGLTLSETSYLPSAKVPKHAHKEAYFSLVLEGGYAEFYERKSRVCDPLALIYLPPNSDHAHRFHDTNSRCFNVELTPEWLTRLENRQTTLERPLEFNNETASWMALQIFREFSQMDALSPLAIEGLMLELLSHCARESFDASNQKIPQWLHQVKDFLHDRFNTSFTLGEIGHEVGVHPVHLARSFRRHFHCSVGEYLRKVRVQIACRKLATSEFSLGELAVMTGFSDQSHFTRTFKRLTGMTPREFYRILHTN